MCSSVGRWFVTALDADMQMHVSASSKGNELSIGGTEFFMWKYDQSEMKLIYCDEKLFSRI